MKKKWIVMLTVSALTCGMLTGCGGDGSANTNDNATITAKEETSSEPGETTEKDTIETEQPEEEIPETISITLNEVAHSIFYAPQYVAIEEGYFEEEGIELNLITGFGVI